MTMITTVSSTPPTKPEMIAATISTMIMKSVNWSSSMRQGERARFSFNSFAPNCARRLAASAELRPDSGLVSRRCATSSMVSVCQLLSLTGMAKMPPDNETQHARFPHPNLPPQTGEGANESLREFQVNVHARKLPMS